MQNQKFIPDSVVIKQKKYNNFFKKSSHLNLHRNKIRFPVDSNYDKLNTKIRWHLDTLVSICHLHGPEQLLLVLRLMRDKWSSSQLQMFFCLYPGHISRCF